MADEPSAQPKPEEAASPGFEPVPEPETSQPSPEQRGNPKWFTNLANRFGIQLPASDDAPAESEASAEEPQEAKTEGEPAKAEPAKADEPEPLTLTAAQLAGREPLPPALDTLVARRAQAEWQRVENKRRQEQQAEELKRKAREQPFDFAEEALQNMEQAEVTAAAEGQMRQLLSNHARQAADLYDRNVLDPVVTCLPKAELQSLLSEQRPDGIEGRKSLVEASLKALEKQWKAEGLKAAKAQLRTDDAFRKEILRELQGLEDEPEQTPPAAPVGNRRGVDMDTWIRQRAGAPRRWTPGQDGSIPAGAAQK